MLEDTIEVKDDENQRYFNYKVQNRGKRFRSKVRYGQCSKEEAAVQKIQNKNSEEIKELTLDFD